MRVEGQVTLLDIVRVSWFQETVKTIENALTVEVWVISQVIAIDINKEKEEDSAIEEESNICTERVEQVKKVILSCAIIVEVSVI